MKDPNDRLAVALEIGLSVADCPVAAMLRYSARIDSSGLWQKPDKPWLAVEHESGAAYGMPHTD